MNDDTNQKPDEPVSDAAEESKNPFAARDNPFANSPRISTSLPAIKPASEAEPSERKLPSLSLPSLPRSSGANPFARRGTPAEPPSPTEPTEQLPPEPVDAPEEEEAVAPLEEEDVAPPTEETPEEEALTAEAPPEVVAPETTEKPEATATPQEEAPAEEEAEAPIVEAPEELAVEASPQEEAPAEEAPVEEDDAEGTNRDTIAELDAVPAFMNSRPDALEEDSTQHEIGVLPRPEGWSEGVEDADDADSGEANTDNVSPSEIAAMMESRPNAFEPDPSWGTSDPSMETIDEIPLAALGDLSGDTSAEDTSAQQEGTNPQDEVFEDDDFAEDATQIYVSGLNKAPSEPSGPKSAPLPVPPSTSGMHARPDTSTLGSGFHRQPSNPRLPQAAPESSGFHAQPAGLASGNYDRPNTSGMHARPDPSASGLHAQPPSPTASGMHAQPAHLSAPPPTAPAEDLRDDDFAAQKTEILQSHFEEDEVVPRLVALQGPVQGQEFFVSGLRATGGRGENNTLVIADMAMSRNHFEIIRNPDNSYLLRDLNSANGCFLNGTQIKEAAIFNGDRIEIGKSVLEFACAPAKAKPHRHLIPVAGVTLEGASDLDDQTRMAALQIDASTRLFTRITLVAGSVSLLLMLALVGLVVSQPSDASSATTTPKVASRGAQDLFLKGVDAVSERDWDLAESYFKRAQSEDASLPATAQLDRVARERKALTLLKEAQQLASQDKLSQAKKLTDEIPAASVYYKEAQQLTRMQRIDEYSTLLQSAQEMLTNDDLENARAKVEQILKSSPGHSGATELRAKIDARAEELKAIAVAEEAKKATPPGPDPFASPDPPNKPEIIKNPSSSASGGSEAEAFSMYKKGNFLAAASAFDAVGGKKAQSRAKGARAMNANYRSGKSAFDARQWSRAISKLGKAKRGDARVNGHYKRKISGMLATSHGKYGTSLLRSKKYKEARVQLLKGQKLDRSNAELGGLARSLESTATRLYIQAVNKKRTNADAASDLCRTIMRMVPSSSPSYKKAKRLFLEL